jgi:hypothetical protein
MAYVTYKNRTSENYRFTTDSLDDPAIAELKELLAYHNGFVKRYRKSPYFNIKNDRPTQGVFIRPRGPRKNSWAYDTPIENATHFDVYIRDYK